MSRLPFELMLALRYLHPKRTFVSFITLISILGVMLGVAVLIIVISVMSGFDKQLRDKILGFSAELRVKHPDGSVMRDYSVPMSIVSSNPSVTGVAPYVMGQVLVETQSPDGSAMPSAPWLRGMDRKLESTVSVLEKSIIVGTNTLAGNSVWVGRDYAFQNRLKLGDTISIYSTRNLKRMRDSRNKGNNETVLPDDYEVTAIFDVGYYEYNASVIVTSLSNAQDLYDMGDSVHGLMLKLKNPEAAEVIGRQIEFALGGDYSVISWLEENSGILDALLVEKNVMFYILFFIMIVAAFGITSALITFVVQKTREIGMLKAIGASNGQVMWIFLSQSMVVGVVGVLAGLGLGLLAVSYRNEFLAFMRQVTHFELFPSRIYNFSQLPATSVPSDYAVICGGSLVICLLAGLLPAWSASRLKPVEALRHE